MGQFLSQWYHVKWWRKFCVETLKQCISNAKKWLHKKDLLALVPRDFFMFILVIIYMKKILDSDWLRAVQFKCNASAKSVTPVQITHRNSGLWFKERQWEILYASDLMQSNDKNFVHKLWKKLSLMEKNGFKKHLLALFPHES